MTHTAKHTPTLYAHQQWITDKATFRLDSDGSRWGETPNFIIDAGTPELAAFIVRTCNAHEGFVRVCGKLIDDYEGKTSMSLEEFSAVKEEMEALLAKARGEA